MHRQLGHLPAMCADHPLLIEATEPLQQLTRLGQCGGGWQRQPAHGGDISNPPLRQLQRQGREVGTDDLREIEGDQMTPL